METAEIVQRQRAYFATGATRPVGARIEALTRLQTYVQAKQADICAALQADLHKAPFESYMSEIGMVLDELRYAIGHVRAWAKPTRVRTPLAQFPARSRIYQEPYGVALIMAPWNYPFLLSVDPLIGALAAGNCAVVKPSAYAPHTSAALAEMARACFSPAHVTVVQGGRAENTALLEQRFDTIFFTGSVAVGKQVMEKAARHLTPVTLELGGKSPCIVDGTVDLALTARRLMFGKVLNAGQTCVAPDYVLVKQEVQQALAAELQAAATAYLGAEPVKNPEYPSIINAKHFARLQAMLDGQPVYFGGQMDAAQRKIAPTVLPATADSPCMQEEIFGPLLPLVPYQTLEQAIAWIQQREKPLALYLFTRDAQTKRRVLEQVSFGGGCINDTIIHLATHEMGFGGVGYSGMGSYHGKRSFDTFSHEKSVVDKGTWMDLPVRYHPYTQKKERLLRRVLK